MGKRKRFRIELCIAIIIAIWVLYKAFKEYSAFKEIELNKAKTTGVIIDYKIIGTYNHYVHYEYFVEGKRFDKNISSEKIFKGCYKNRDCIGRKFVVYYSKENPEKSEIDLDQEIN